MSVVTPNPPQWQKCETEESLELELDESVVEALEAEARAHQRLKRKTFGWLTALAILLGLWV